jgi:Cytochrome c554 and c-prime
VVDSSREGIVRRLIGILIALLALAFVVRAQQPSTAGDTRSAVEKTPPPPGAYAGDAACRQCHGAESSTYATTAHHLTSRLPTAQTIGGSFKESSNILHTANPKLIFRMDTANNRFYQTAILEDENSQPRTLTESIDLVIGSDRKGQTYLYWEGDDLFELPVSYWKSVHSWINSPGYPDGAVHFYRAVPPHCLECHASYFQSQAPPVNHFAKSSLVLGISCEKCHGPGREHVDRERSSTPPGRGSANLAIVNPAHLSRERQLDLCSLCHAGISTPIAPSLSFLPGDAIDDYVEIHDPGPDVQVDVHGNQVLALRRSKCFESSQMTCSTCHNTHKPQRDAASFSANCISCHSIKACGKFAEMGEKIRDRCVDCHMPLQKSQVLYSDSVGQHIEPLIRNHKIAIYR